jgi:tRNA pseudouridine55 synthase
MNGFLNLHKAAGMTSHDCVAQVRRILRTKKVGHGGTLDPAATGVLPIAINKATRLLQYLSHDKAYIGTIRFGDRTTTDDLEGEIISSAACPDLTLDTIQAVLPQFIGTIQQIPPSFSAIQVDGKRLYDLARAGQLVEAPMRTVVVHNIEVLAWKAGDFPELTVAIACGTGTYIRAIARDLGNAVGTGATLASLQRTRSSGFELQDSLTLEQLKQQVESATFNVVDPVVGLMHLEAIALSDEQARRWLMGQKITGEFAQETSYFQVAQVLRVHRQTGGFLGIGEWVRSTLPVHEEPLQQGNLQQGNLQQGNLQQGNLQQGNLQQGNLQQGNLQQGNLQQGNLQSEVLEGQNQNQSQEQGQEQEQTFLVPKLVWDITD